MTIVGFTGTRQGMTAEQAEAFVRWMRALRPTPTRFVHGACIGADSDAVYALAGGVPIEGLRIIARPSNLRRFRSPSAIMASDRVWRGKAPLNRNADIVRDCDVLIACPAGFEEELRSGTWATVRYARRAAKAILVIWPDGRAHGEPSQVRHAGRPKVEWPCGLWLRPAPAPSLPLRSREDDGPAS